MFYKAVIVALSFFTLICLCVSGLAILAISAANGAPQEASAASMACAFAVVPYVLLRTAQICAETLGLDK